MRSAVKYVGVLVAALLATGLSAKAAPGKSGASKPALRTVGGDPATTGSIPANAGSVTGLAVPRFVSLKPSDTPMREGPGKSHAISWIFKREGLPVEITAEFENWRRVRDSEGAEGWVYHSRLSGRRTVMVRGRAKAGLVALYRTESEEDGISARLSPGVIAGLETCDGSWCKLRGDDFSGFVRQSELWGVYPAEVVK